MFKLINYIPEEYHNSIFEVDYNKLYAKGIRLILTDLDNTLISYKDILPTSKLFAWKKDLEQKGFEVLLISNSHKKRVKRFSEEFSISYVNSAKKPLRSGFKRALKKAMNKYEKNQIIILGDQLLTDIYGGNKYGITTILIKAIERKTERLITKFNRFFEKFILNKIKKKYPEKYLLLLSNYHENS